MTHDIPRFTTSDGGLTWASTGTHGGYDGDEGLTWAEQVARRDAEIERLRAERDEIVEDRNDLRRRLRKTSDAYNDARNELYEANANLDTLRDRCADLQVTSEQLVTERDEWKAEAERRVDLSKVIAYRCYVDEGEDAIEFDSDSVELVMWTE